MASVTFIELVITLSISLKKLMSSPVKTFNSSATSLLISKPTIVYAMGLGALTEKASN